MYACCSRHINLVTFVIMDNGRLKLEQIHLFIYLINIVCMLSRDVCNECVQRINVIRS